MPGGSFQDAVRRRQEAGFVARTGELAQFRANLSMRVDDLERRFIFCVHGDGGVGKTFWLRRLRSIAAEVGAATGWVDEPVFGVPEAMQAIASDLTRQGVDTSGFTKLMDTYLSRRFQVETDTEAPAGAAAFMTQTAVRVGLHAAQAVPGVGGLAGSVDPAAAADQAEQLRRFLGKKFRRREDVRMLLSPLDALTPAFVRDLADAGRRRSLALFFDTYEQTGPLLDGWLRSVLDGAYGDLPQDLIVTIAGRHPLDLGDWAPYAAVLADVPLTPFTEAESRQLLAEKGVTNERVVQVILEVSGRLPLLVATLAENQPTDPAAVGDPSGDAVERFLKWEPDPARRALAVTAALPRVVNEDVLCVLSGQGQQQDHDQGWLFAWLRSLPFISHESGRCTYHEVVRSAMLRLERGQSPARWRERHQALAAAYQQWSLQVSTEDSWNDSSWRASKLEETYHLLCADATRALPGALSQVTWACAHGVTAAAQWAQMLAQAGGDSGSEKIRVWGQRLEQSLRGNPDQATVTTLGILLHEGGITDEAIFAALRTRGRALYLLSREQEALTDFDQAINMTPGDQRALAYRGDTYRFLGQYEKALADLGRALDLVPDDAWAISRRGAVLMDTGQYEEALADLSRAVGLAPDDAWAISRRGAAYKVMGRYGEALADFSRAIDLDPDDSWGMGGRGQVYREMGRFEEAVADLSRAIDLDPHAAWLHGDRGEAYREMGRYEEAVADFSRAINLAADYDWAIGSRGQAYREMGRFEEAVADLSRAIDLAPDTAWLFGDRGEAYRQMGRHEEALTDLTRAIDLAPGYDWAICSRGEAYRVMGRYEEALADFSRAIDLSPEYRWALSHRGEAYREMGRYEEALADFSRAIDLDPDDSWGMGGRGQVYQEMGRYEEALADFSRAIDLDPETAWLHGDRGQVYRRMGRYEEALTDLTRAIDLRPDNDWYRYGCSLIHICRGESGEGSRYLEFAMDLVMATIESSANQGHDFYNLAIYKTALGNYGQASHDFREAVRKESNRRLINDAIVDLRDLSSVPGVEFVEVMRLIEFLEH
jgi:tetratricopeptide (TPR) repeat protein